MSFTAKVCLMSWTTLKCPTQLRTHVHKLHSWSYLVCNSVFMLPLFQWYLIPSSPCHITICLLLITYFSGQLFLCSLFPHTSGTKWLLFLFLINPNFHYKVEAEHFPINTHFIIHYFCCISSLNYNWRIIITS